MSMKKHGGKAGRAWDMKEILCGTGSVRSAGNGGMVPAAMRGGRANG